MTVLVRWAASGSAVVLQTQGVRVLLRSTVPFPPGTPAVGTLAIDDPIGFQLKVTGSRRSDDEHWEVRGRLVSASSAAIAAFAAAATEQPE